MTIRERIASASARVGDAAEKFTPWARDLERHRALEDEGERLRQAIADGTVAAVVTDGRVQAWYAGPRELAPDNARPWAELDEDQRLEYLGNRAAEMAEHPGGAPDVLAVMERDGVPAEDRERSGQAAVAWGSLAAEADADPDDPFRPDRELEAG